MSNNVTRYWVREVHEAVPEFVDIYKEGVFVVRASDYDALRKQLEQEQGELRYYKESWHERIQAEINRVRESLKIHRVIARGSKHDESLMIIEGGDAQTIMVAHPSDALQARCDELQRELDGEGGPVPMTVKRDNTLKCAVCDHSEQEFIDLQARVRELESVLEVARRLQRLPAVLVVTECSVEFFGGAVTPTPVTQDYVDEVWNQFIDTLEKVKP